MPRPYIRYGIHRDLHDIEAIEYHQHDTADACQWRTYLGSHRYSVLVICERRVQAAMVLRVRRKNVYVERMVAHHDFGEFLAASMFLEEICGNIPDGRRLVLQVDEYELDWQLFLQERGFLATANIRGAGNDGSDVIQMEYGVDLIAEMAANT